MNGTYHVVSLSGGKDSTAMLLMMLERGMRVDEVVFADTGMEFPAMAAHLQRVEKYTGIPITYLRHPQGFEHLMFDRVLTKGRREGERGYGWARMNSRWCTKHLTTELIDKHVREIAEGREVVQYIGIAADEAWRAKEKRYPLIEWGITESDALAYCYSIGFDWDGLYRIFDRVSCWCCPLKNLGELRKLRHEFPELWQRLREMDARSYNTFRIDYNVKQLEHRFAQEDRQMSIFQDGMRSDAS